jgi:hypothetical protein
MQYLVDLVEMDYLSFMGMDEAIAQRSLLVLLLSLESISSPTTQTAYTSF